ncbi:hypothetical protein AK830_g7376 [Neonectria ditissima]|uniref:Annexin n=1 Tax=Neonectria ditissima TaxID=78410 RepID=A0A0P7BEZ9_9HYPO|nr:hypothetical protein AK830_g7376 [Neonectria ditissima]
MSLYPGDRDRKGRSRSRSRDRRSRDEPAQAPPVSYADVREPSYVYPEDDLDDRYRGRSDAQASGALPYPEQGGLDSYLPGGGQGGYGYDSQKPAYKTASPPLDSQHRSSRDKVDSSHLPGSFPDDEPPHGKGKDKEPHIRYVEPREGPYESRRDDKYDGSRRDDKYDSRHDDKHDKREEEEDKLKFLPQKYSRKLAAVVGGSSLLGKKDKDDKGSHEDDLAYGKPPVPKRPPPGNDDLAYGKATGVPTSAGHSMASFGTQASIDPHNAKRDERYDDGPGETYGERRDGNYNDWRDERKDDKFPSKYAARDDSPDRRHAAGGYDSHRYGDDRIPHSPTAEARASHRRGDSLLADPYSSSANVLTVEPGSRDRDRSRDRRREKSSDPRGSSDLLDVESSSRKREKSRSRDKSKDRSDRSRGHHRDKSPGPSKLSVEPGRRERSRSRDARGSSSLTVDSGRLAGMSLAAAPASPLLESYYGTYQDCSPMPSPLLLASQNMGDDARGLEPLSPIGSDFEGDGKKRGRRARFHDPEDITSQLAQALKGSKRPDTAPLIEILPSLTHEQVMELRVEYKRLVKTGSERKGVNVAKHIRARLKDEDPLLTKACYAVALGMWESEAYWANFWYQGDKTRRELLIESLMGRTNEEVRAIKDAFSDKKYDNSLTKCMKTELREDKFKKGVMMILEERRMEEYDGYGHPLPIDYELVDLDVSELRRSVKSEKGGETSMITIVVQRSDSHLRAVLQEYERHYRSNFARDALKKSGNLVGELLAHILNGVINRPVRDALLLHHAITASRKDGLRRELLISRLVRYHWDPNHMRAVKHAYRERYGRGLSDVVREATSGEWGLFCRELCITRTPDDVRRFEKVAISVR